MSKEENTRQRDIGTGSPANRATDTSSRLGNFHLLAIGVDEYLHWPRLKSAVRDTKAVAETLQREYGFESKRVVELYNAAATAKNINAELRRLAKELEPADSLLIFYAGHGHLDELTGTGSWIPVDAERDAATYLDNARIKAILRAAKVRHILLVSDSCFAGDFFQQHREGLPEITDDYVRRAFGKSSRQVITSGGLEPVADEGIGGHSWFTHYLLQELRQNQSPYLLPSDLWNRIRGGVAANAKQQPLFGILEGTGGEIGGEFVLFRKGAGGTLDDLLVKKRQQVTALEKAEAEAQEAAARERALQQQKEAELRKLDEQIAAMQARLRPASAVTGEDTAPSLACSEPATTEVAAQKMQRLEELAQPSKSVVPSPKAVRQQHESQTMKPISSTTPTSWPKIVSSLFWLFVTHLLKSHSLWVLAVCIIVGQLCGQSHTLLSQLFLFGVAGGFAGVIVLDDTERATVVRIIMVLLCWFLCGLFSTVLRGVLSTVVGAGAELGMDRVLGDLIGLWLGWFVTLLFIVRYRVLWRTLIMIVPSFAILWVMCLCVFAFGVKSLGVIYGSMGFLSTVLVKFFVWNVKIQDNARTRWVELRPAGRRWCPFYVE